MPLVNVMVNGRAYTIACDDGEEEHLRQLAATVDAKTREVLSSVGQVGDTRLLLMAALLIADEHHGKPDVADHQCRKFRLAHGTGSARQGRRRPGRGGAGAGGHADRKPCRGTVGRLICPGHAAPKQIPFFAGNALYWRWTVTASRVRLAMPRGLNVTHRELSLPRAVALGIWRPPAKQAREDPHTNGECGTVHLAL